MLSCNCLILELIKKAKKDKHNMTPCRNWCCSELCVGKTLHRQNPTGLYDMCKILAIT